MHTIKKFDFQPLCTYIFEFWKNEMYHAFEKVCMLPISMQLYEAFDIIV